MYFVTNQDYKKQSRLGINDNMLSRVFVDTDGHFCSIIHIAIYYHTGL